MHVSLDCTNDLDDDENKIFDIINSTVHVHVENDINIYCVIYMYIYICYYMCTCRINIEHDFKMNLLHVMDQIGLTHVHVSVQLLQYWDQISVYVHCTGEMAK